MVGLNTVARLCGQDLVCVVSWPSGRFGTGNLCVDIVLYYSPTRLRSMVLGTIGREAELEHSWRTRGYIDEGCGSGSMVRNLMGDLLIVVLGTRDVLYTGLLLLEFSDGRSREWRLQSGNSKRIKPSKKVVGIEPGILSGREATFQKLGVDWLQTSSHKRVRVAGSIDVCCGCSIDTSGGI